VSVSDRERDLLAEAARALPPKVRTHSELLDELEVAIAEGDELAVTVLRMSLRVGSFSPDPKTPLEVIRGGAADAC